MKILAKMIFIIIGAVAIVLAAGILWPGAKDQSQIGTASSKYAPDFSPRQNSEGGVAITVAYLNSIEKDTLAFEVKMDTHSGALDYDLKKLAYLKDSAGNIYRPIDWDGAIGGHHVSGVLKFTKPRTLEKGLILVIQEVAGVKERVFEW